MFFDLHDILKILELPYINIPYGVYIKCDLETIKKNYRSLIKKYHPDNSTNDDDKKYYEEKMTEINVSMEKLLRMIENHEVSIMKSNNVSNKDIKTNKKEENFDVVHLVNKFDNLKKSVNSKKTEFSSVQIIKVIDLSLNYLDNIRNLVLIYIERGEIYDYWDYINYIDLFNYYFNKTLNINCNNFNKKLDYNFKNDILLDEKKKLSSLHRILLFNKVNELIDLFKKIKNISFDEYLKKYDLITDSIESIDSDIHNIKWFIELNINKEEVKKRIKKLGGD